MPKRFERHARSGNGYEANPARHDELTAAINTDPEPVKRSPGKKDPSSCKGNQGGPHVPIVMLRSLNPQQQARNQCRYVVVWNRQEEQLETGWHCDHMNACGKCGLVYDSSLRSDRCQAYPGELKQRAEVQRLADERNKERRISPRWHRRPVITGRQSYRRPASE